ncbi:hypothetical protein B0H13DRAFT_1920487 [Mycena leptocephala]|nr:hypothetical protein B0H13DRAFT_1920487 [Mycena leptocephala]
MDLKSIRVLPANRNRLRKLCDVIQNLGRHYLLRFKANTVNRTKEVMDILQHSEVPVRPLRAAPKWYPLGPFTLLGGPKPGFFPALGGPSKVTRHTGFWGPGWVGPLIAAAPARAAAEKFALFTAVGYVFVYTGWLLLSLLQKG